MRGQRTRRFKLFVLWYNSLFLLLVTAFVAVALSSGPLPLFGGDRGSFYEYESFIVLGDTQLNYDPLPWEGNETFRHPTRTPGVLEAIRDLPDFDNVGFVLHVGDLNHFTNTHALIREYLGDVPTFYAMGNHERDSGFQGYAEGEDAYMFMTNYFATKLATSPYVFTNSPVYAPDTMYGIRIGSVAAVLIDPHHDGMAPILPTEHYDLHTNPETRYRLGLIAFVTNAFAATDAQFRFTVCHYPLIEGVDMDSGTPNMYSGIRPNTPELIGALNQAGIDAHLNGHTHTMYYGYAGDVLNVNAGHSHGISTIYGDPSSFVKVDVFPRTGKIRYNLYRNLDGTGRNYVLRETIIQHYNQDIELTGNPYSGVSWSSDTSLRANLSAVTSKGRGSREPDEVIDTYHEMDYDVLSLADDNVVTWPWSEYERDPEHLGMLAVQGSTIENEHSVLSLFNDYGHDFAPRSFFVFSSHHPGFRALPEGDFTLEAWFRTEKRGRAIIMGDYSPMNPTALNLELTDKDEIRLYIRPPASMGAPKSLAVNTIDALGVDTRDGHWHHLAARREGDTLSLFLNGKNAGGKDEVDYAFRMGQAFYFFGQDFRLGEGLEFEGDLYSPRIWKRALSDVELTALSDGVAPGDEGGPARDNMLVEYRFETTDEEPVYAGLSATNQVDDTAGYADDPINASASFYSAGLYIEDVPEGLSPGASSFALRMSVPAGLQGVLDGIADAGGAAYVQQPAAYWSDLFGVPSFHIPYTDALREAPQGDFTVETWFRTTSRERGVLMGNYFVGSVGTVNLELHEGNKVRVYMVTFEADVYDLNVSAGAATRDGAWHHLAAVRSGGDLRLYFNGELVGERADSAGAFHLDGTHYYMARDGRTDGAVPFVGGLDMPRFWSRALSAEEVGDLAAGAVPGDDEGPSREGIIFEYAFETSRGAPTRAGMMEDDVLDDTSGHPAGATPAYPDGGIGGVYSSDVPSALKEAGHSRLSMGFGRGSPQELQAPKLARLKIPLSGALRDLPSGDFTLETWFRTEAEGRHVLLGNFPGDGLVLNLELFADNEVRLFLQCVDVALWEDFHAPVDFADTRDGAWHHLAATRSGGTLRLYLDGQFAAERSGVSTEYSLGGEYYFIGSDYRQDGQEFHGDLAQPRFWSRALNDAEIEAVWQGYQPGAEGGPVRADLVADYPFTHSRGQPAHVGESILERTDESARHPDGPFHAELVGELGGLLLGDVPAVLRGADGERVVLAVAVGDLTIEQMAGVFYADYYARNPHLYGLEVLDADQPFAMGIWDQLLARLMPHRPVWGTASDRSEGGMQTGVGWVVIPAARNDERHVRAALHDGAYYFGSTRVQEGLTPSRLATPRVDEVFVDEHAGMIRVSASVEGGSLGEDAYRWITRGGREIHRGPELWYRQVPGLERYARVEIAGEGGTAFLNPFGFTHVDQPHIGRLAVVSGMEVELDWGGNEDPRRGSERVAGYIVERSEDGLLFDALHEGLITETHFVDSVPSDGEYYYRVRMVLDGSSPTYSLVGTRGVRRGFLDSNQDGIPDYWKLEQGMGVDDEVDVETRERYVAGTSDFYAGITAGKGPVRITFGPSLVGRRYVLERHAGRGGQDGWHEVPGGVLKPGRDAHTGFIEDAAEAHPAFFYRVQVEWAE